MNELDDLVNKLGVDNVLENIGEDSICKYLLAQYNKDDLIEMLSLEDTIKELKDK